MEYNFSYVMVDAIADFEKKLRKIEDNVLDEISNFCTVLNDQKIIDRAGELRTEIKDVFSDAHKRLSIIFTGCMNEVQAKLHNYL